MAELLRLEKVSKRFGGIVAVDRVSLVVEEGESLGIIGPNGSGKTTLFNLINGVYTPDEGRIFFKGQDITRTPPYRRAQMGIARSFQIPRPWGSLTAQENVAIGALFGARGGQLDVDEALERAREALRLVGLEGKEDVPAHSLTVVEKKLLEMARALAMDPSLLLLDEVMAGMSPRDVDRVVETIKRVKREKGIAVVALVEHLMRAVTAFAERVVVMHQGRLILEGAPEKVMKDPLLVEVYLGEPVEV